MELTVITCNCSRYIDVNKRATDQRVKQGDSFINVAFLEVTVIIRYASGPNTEFQLGGHINILSH